MLQNINSFGILASHWLHCVTELEMYPVQASEEKKLPKKWRHDVASRAGM